MSDDNYFILKDSFPLDNINNNENCWEETTFANMTNLFKFYFSQNKSKLLFIKYKLIYKKLKK